MELFTIFFLFQNALWEEYFIKNIPFDMLHGKNFTKKPLPVDLCRVVKNP